jgi:hypothetical protein
LIPKAAEQLMGRPDNGLDMGVGRERGTRQGFLILTTPLLQQEVVEKKILQSMTSDFYDFQISNLSLLID